MYRHILLWVALVSMIFGFKSTRDDNLFKGGWAIISPGKIYIKGDILYVNDSGFGVHIFDISTINSPERIKFLEVDDNYDMAAKDSFLYVDNGPDLLVYNVAEPAKPTLAKTIKNAFWATYENWWWDEEGYYDGIGCGCTQTSVDYENSGDGSGQGGSMARFTIVGDYLYAVDLYDIIVFDIVEPGNPVKVQTLEVGWDIETIFGYEDLLFVGSMRGMYIYRIMNRGLVEYVSQFQHARACDPVVVQNDTAYITLRTGTRCGPANNELLLVDVSDITNPKLIEKYDMQDPHGLAVFGDYIFLCEGEKGLSLYHKSADLTLNPIYTDTNVFGYDVIYYDELLILTGATGVYLYVFDTGFDLMDKVKLPDEFTK